MQGKVASVIDETDVGCWRDELESCQASHLTIEAE